MKTYCLRPVRVEAHVGGSEFGQIPKMVINISGPHGIYIVMDRDAFDALFQEVEVRAPSNPTVERTVRVTAPTVEEG